MTHNTTGNEWLCRHCNTLVDNQIAKCPNCQADRPEEEIAEPSPEGISQEIVLEGYTNVGPKVKAKYNFREGVLVNAADITLIIGLFCTFASLIAPIIVDFGVTAPMLWATCIAIVIFATTMVSWALLRTIADISRRTREMHERE